MVISTFDIIMLPPGLKGLLAARVAAVLNSRAAPISMDSVKGIRSKMPAEHMVTIRTTPTLGWSGRSRIPGQSLHRLPQPVRKGERIRKQHRFLRRGPCYSLK
jgi:hypothetical protein